MNLAKQLKDHQNKFLEQADFKTQSTMKEATEKLIASGIEEKTIKTGDYLPMFALADQNGKSINIAQILRIKKLVVTFYRGKWCPYCNLAVAALQKIIPEIKNLGADLVAISPELPENAQDMITKNQLSFPVLYDKNNEIARELGLVFKLTEELASLYQNFNINVAENNGQIAHELPLPATFVIDQDGKVIYDFINADYTKRAEPSDILKALNS